MPHAIFKGKWDTGENPEHIGTRASEASADQFMERAHTSDPTHLYWITKYQFGATPSSDVNDSWASVGPVFDPKVAL